METTTVFFGVTKLFQSTNQNLRRMMYLFIKEVAETCNPDDVIIVTSSLTKVGVCGEECATVYIYIIVVVGVMLAVFSLLLLLLVFIIAVFSLVPR